jgi:hypothetical protein
MLSFTSRLILIGVFLLFVFAVASLTLNILSAQNIYHAINQRNTLLIDTVYVNTCYYIQWIWIALLSIFCLVTLYFSSKIFKWFHYNFHF